MTSDAGLVVRTSGGTAARRILDALAGTPAFDRWREGLVDRRAYTAALDGLLGCPARAGLTDNQVALSARMRWRPGEAVAEALDACVAAGLVPTSAYDTDRFCAERERIEGAWDHGGRTTFIFPEEAQLLFALADLVRPRRVAVLGSYYAYWAVWALAGSGPAMEHAVLLDVDPAVNALAAANLAALGFDGAVDVVTDDAVAYMARTDERFDLLVLDAEAPPDAEPRLRGKAIYGPIAEAALPRLRPGGLLVVHNVLLDDLVAHPYFEGLVAHNRAELDEFLGRVAAACPRSVHVPTTEGVGVYRKA